MNNKFFFVNLSEIEGRLDPMMILYNQKVKSYSHPAKPVKNFLLSKPQYGAAESGIFRTDVNQMRYIRITDIDEYGYLIDEMGVSADISPLEQHKYLLKNNDILLARSGATVGKCYIHKSTEVQYPCTFAGYLIRLRFDENIILPDYFFIITQLNIYKDWVKAIQRVTAQPNINADEYGNFPLPIMPIDKQKEIINIFHKSMLKRKSKLIQSQTLLNSISDYLLEQLGIIVPSVNNALNNRIFMTSFSELDERLDPNFYFHREIKMTDGHFENIELGEIAHLIKGTSLSSKNVIDGDYPVIAGGQTSPYNHHIYNFDGESITVSASGAYSGYVAYHNYPIFASDCTVIKVIDNNEILPQFLFELLKLKQDEIYLLQKGAAQPHVYANDLAKIKIPLPDLPTQKSIVQHINQIRQQAQALEQEAIDLLKQTQDEIEMMILQ